jgi:hypothetical protein
MVTHRRDAIRILGVDEVKIEQSHIGQPPAKTKMYINMQGKFKKNL